jgi:hypothetical protein
MSDGLVDQAKVILLAYNIISGIVDIWLVLVFFGLIPTDLYYLSYNLIGS